MTANSVPKMKEIEQIVSNSLSGFLVSGEVPVLQITADDNLTSNVFIRGSFDAEDTWGYGIYENSKYFQIHLWPAKGARYYNGGPVTLELTRASYKLSVPKLRKYTGPPEKVVEKVRKWIEANLNT